MKRLFKSFVALLAIAATAIGPAWGQNSNPDVILDFTTNSWGLPTTGNNHGPESYFNGTYAITLSTPSFGTNTYRLNSGYLLLGRSGAYLELPEFSSPVEKIEVVGNSAASPQVIQNIYVGETAVSTQTTGATGTNTYVIAENYRAAGNIYTLKVESGENTQITYIKVYYVSSGGGLTPEPEPAPTPHTVRMAAGTEDAANWSIASGDASVTGNLVLANVMSGSQVTATYNGTTKKVKSVKAVKYVAPAATVTTAPTATAATIEANSTTALVNAGAASGGTMMYAVTTTNVQPASTADFSATRPTAEGRTAGTYYVWYYAKADAEHSDSEIAGPVSVTVAEATPALSITSPAKGQVIGSDGKNYAAGATLPSGVTKVAMIAYVSGSNGLAIALADEGNLNWATAKSTCEAKTPAFTNGTWHLPSQAEWNQMFSANGGDEERCYGLNAAITTAGGTALLEGGTGYWSSTPNGSNVWYVWLMDGDTDWRSGNVNLAKQVRACLAF